MTSTSSPVPNGAPAGVVVEGSPPHQPSPPPAKSQLQPHSQLLSTSPAVEEKCPISSAADSISASGHNAGRNNITNALEEQARHHRRGNDNTITDGTDQESPSQTPTTITTKPHSKKSAAQQARTPKTAADEQAKTTSNSEPPDIRRPKAPTTRLNAHQIFYIFILDGLGAMILSGAINFAIAYAMYASGPAAAARRDDQVPSSPRILLFHLPNSLAGDAAVTIVLQTAITWLVEYLLVNRDLDRGGVRPVGFVKIPQTRTGVWRFVRWFCFVDTEHEEGGNLSSAKDSSNLAGGVIPGTEKEERDSEAEVSDTATSNRGWVSFLWSQIARALVVAVVMFVLLWGPCVGILMALGRRDKTIGAMGDWVFERRVWLPQGFKLILGGLLALLETPAFAFFWMVQAGWALRRDKSTGVGAETGIGVVGEEEV